MIWSKKSFKNRTMWEVRILGGERENLVKNLTVENDRGLSVEII